MRCGEFRVLICQLLADGDSLVVLACHNVNQSDHRGGDRCQRIELVGTISLSKGLLLSAPNPANIVSVSLVCDSVIGIKFESLLEFSLSSGKIPVVLHLGVAENSMGIAQRAVQLQRFA